jgi:2-polyprenyl-6-methoxyphenol hydroxylase-like FAD-dependent oxidoreductase
MSVRNVLVVGGGISGTVAAVALAQKGVRVTLVEISPEWFGVGHGITVQGNALRVFKQIGALDKMLENGLGFDNLTLFHADGSAVRGARFCRRRPCWRRRLSLGRCPWFRCCAD